MLLSKEEVEHIALLARLSLSEEEKERYREQLSSILGHVAQLQELDTSNIEALTSVLAEKMPLRKDIPKDGFTLNETMKNAPAIKNEHFQVPLILDCQDE